MTSADPILTTERTIVETVTLDDAELFFELHNTPGWLRYIGDKQVHDLEAARGRIRDPYLKSYEDHGFGCYLVRGRADRVPMGIAGFMKRPNLDYPDLGFAFLPAFHGQGLAGEVCTALLEFGVERFGFEALDAVTVPDNAASIRLLERLGFRLEGTTRFDGDGSELRLYRWKRSQRQL